MGGCSLQEYGQREQPSLPQTRFLLSIPNLPSEKRFAHRRKRGYIKVNTLKVQRLNCLKLPNKQTSEKNNLSSHSSPNHPAHNLRQSPTISGDLRQSSSTDPRRTAGVFLYSPQVSLRIQIKMAAAVWTCESSRQAISWLYFPSCDLIKAEISCYLR